MVNNSSKGTEIKDNINRPIDCQTSTDELDVSVDAGRLESMKLEICVGGKRYIPGDEITRFSV